MGARWAFEAPVVYWRGPTPHVFARLPEPVAAELRALGPSASYGWGCIPVEATIGGIRFTTALFPKDGGYLLPLKLAVRRNLDLADDALVGVEMAIIGRDLE